MNPYEKRLDIVNKRLRRIALKEHREFWTQFTPEEISAISREEPEAINKYRQLGGERVSEKLISVLTEEETLYLFQGNLQAVADSLRKDM
ncbi:MAG: hypothetical protein ABFD50_17625 [Smithella sp.]